MVVMGAVPHLGNHYSTRQNIPKKLVYMLPYKIAKVYQLHPQHCAQQMAFSHSTMDSMSPDEGPSRHFDSSNECVSHVSGFSDTQIIRIWRSENTIKIKHLELHSEDVIFWWDGLTYCVVDSYFYNNESGKKVSYFQMLYSYILSECQQIKHNDSFQPEGAPPQITRTACPLFEGLFSNL